MSETFLLKKDLKDVRGSFFERGFAIPVDKQAILSRYLRGGALRNGEKRTIKILLGGKSFEVTLRSVGFNRKNYPNHSEIWQVNWTAVDAIAATVKKIFSRSYNDSEEMGECGRKVGEFYGVDLAECHHIEPFSQSLNNNASNLLIVCPNHHRIIHAAAPTFDRERKLYLYPNGCTETLQLNEHL